MTRNGSQDRAIRLASPVPAHALEDAARLWWRHFGGRGRAGTCRAERGVVALDDAGRVLGVAGLRDDGGGFVPDARGVLRHLFRPAPPTADLVVDGIAVAEPRGGIGRLLLAEAEAQARRRGRPGLRVEVRASNASARAFYAATGFHEETRGRFGLPWWGQVLVLRREAA
ncbi:GNAT family N-acetyltransferase [Paracoccus sp. 1_MG-2023]|uniref:GNAT family N-acetyltransferase n=1 Tax=unclassified Paracoccus (in: a-proteobacteria) TaxID=2688777 RepID=UPI001C0A3985|nr:MULTISPECIES: GNAT family N-acetyltransferase [unclassified Paracoccus (in: a-proteobacteria)]MBU2956970.1 GNAT family N-acetyltransferase [Paracoccus sp. C2R09]MDO6668167.1 GNAT family N-acetyltransferase [Paracoccus sp. 1_MG-2023]